MPRDHFAEIGVKPFINAAAAYSALGGRNMWPEVVEAMEYARQRNVIMEELQDAVGKRLVSLIKCEAAMVTGGATSAMTLGTAACITGTNEELIRQVPDLRGMKNEVIIQKSHRYSYDHGVRSAGVQFVEVETAEELEHAIGDKTAMLFFFFLNDAKGQIKLREFAALGKKHGSRRSSTDRTPYRPSADSRNISMPASISRPSPAAKGYADPIARECSSAAKTSSQPHDSTTRPMPTP